MVYSFLCGFFGLAAYAYSLMGLIIGIAVTFNVRPKMRLSKALTYFGLLILGIFALQIYTSSTHIVGANYAEYLLACYNNTNTAGGMLLGVPAYPLMKVITSVGALIAACVAFFILAFFAIYPSIKRNVTYTVATKGERDKKLKAPKQKRSFFSKRKSKSPNLLRLWKRKAHPPSPISTRQGRAEDSTLWTYPAIRCNKKSTKKL